MLRKTLITLTAIAALGLGSTAMAKHVGGHRGGVYGGGVYGGGGYGLRNLTELSEFRKRHTLSYANGGVQGRPIPGQRGRV
jgi:hypothetical protein